MIKLLSNLPIIAKLKIGVQIVMVTLIVVLSCSSFLLYKSNDSLRMALHDKEVKLLNCKASLDLANKQKQTIDDSLSAFFDEHEKLSDDFLELNKKFNDRKCKSRVEHIYLRSGKGHEKTDQNVIRPDADTAADDIRAIGLLLNEAACRANGECTPERPESPNKAM